jgi:hypothetical protein
VTISQKQLDVALQKIAEEFHAIDETLAKLQVAVRALKVVVAARLTPGFPKEGLKLIEEVEQEFAKLDPHAEARQRFSDVIEMQKIFEKHGGPKQA